jgi:4-oxalocrotonate tautomerase
VPKDDRFQVISERPPLDLVVAQNYLGIEHTDDCVIIQITLNQGRSVDQKKAFFNAIADGLHERLELRRETLS